MNYFVHIHFQLENSVLNSPSLQFDFAFASLWSASLPFSVVNSNVFLHALFWFFLLIKGLFFSMVFFLLFCFFLSSSFTLIFVLKRLDLCLFIMLFMPILHSLAMLVE